MDNDEERQPSINRRTVLAGGAAAAAAAVGIGAGAAAYAAGDKAAPAATRAAVCSLTEEVTEGPYALAGALIREDVTEGKAGVPVKFSLTVVDQANGCSPLANALVEIWHCDALGEYSGFVGRNGHQESDDRAFLRGGQFTDSTGVVKLTSIWPGHYTGRCVHVHLRVHTNVTLTGSTYTGGSLIHTGQLFFDPTINTQVQKLSPYSSNTTPETQLSQDGIYDGGGATSGLLTLTPLGSTVSAGYTATLTMGVTSTRS